MRIALLQFVKEISNVSTKSKILFLLSLGLKTMEFHLAKECYNIGTKAHHPRSTWFNLSLNSAATGGK